MALFEDIYFYSPIIRCKLRDRHIAFYQKTLGFRLIKEENTLVSFSDWSQETSHFQLEETPGLLSKDIRGPKKLHQMIIKTPYPQEIESLLANGAKASRIFKGEKGYAFEAFSPENDCFLLHAENDLAALKEITADQLNFHALEDFKGLSEFKVERIILNVLDKKSSQAFYQELFQNQFPLSLDFVETKGADLAAEPYITRDLEILEIRVPKDYDLKDAKAYFESKGQKVYLDKSEKVLVISDPSQIEIWFHKIK
ncbi:CppA N-terminal domain-containing protein [Streptococcus macacae]|uniref:CppA protein n=1 Tax=Streptococcus macacae NCTC 11558 TaxID=764298 RepID=G5JXX3_9STRE|nr:CppA N-terminal domain-containing protein [Streptococcus macacae]EHJ51992.1 hypothetical protein STRMA_0018 [Streptococcus macacae NCTC 11558]SUN77892.1 C3-degrading proteinase [Streptococcus macacae NCTC 11558]